MTKFDSVYSYKLCKKEILPEIIFFLELNNSPTVELLESAYLKYSIEAIAPHLIQDLIKLLEMNPKNKRLKQILNFIFQITPDDYIFQTIVIIQGTI